MASDETPPSVPTLRPLPSLGIPLLREEVERQRRRRAWTIAGLAGALLLLVGLAALASSAWPTAEEEPETPTDAVPAHVGYTPPVDAAVPPPDAFVPSPVIATEELPEGTRAVHRFGQSAGFRPALNAAGLSAAEADAVTTALTGVLDFRRCRPDHELIIERRDDGTLQRFEYRAGITQVYEARRGPDDRFHGAQVEIPIDRVDLARGGTVTTSLGDALEQLGLGRALVGAFVEAFDGRMNFNTETRSGDTFRLIVTEERVDGQLLRYGTVHALEYQSQRRGELRAFYFAPREDLEDFYDESGRALHGGWLRLPVRFDHISSPFDPRRMHPILRRITPHNGIDYAAAPGTPVWAAADGEVTWVGERGANGNLVSLEHADGYETHYAHLSRFAPGLARGAHVRQRQLIGYVGSTGRSTGPHLHFGLKHRGRFIDPAAVLNGPGRMLPTQFQRRFRQEITELRGALARIAIEPAAPVTEAPAGATERPADPMD